MVSAQKVAWQSYAIEPRIPSNHFCLPLLIAPCLLGQQLQQPSPVVRSSVNEVLVPVVVRDAHGHVVGNLTKEDFQVFDNGKPQKITGFTLIKRATENSAANSSAPGRDAIDSPAVSQPPSPPQRFVAILFDAYDFSSKHKTG
jgi:hypothetical protein